MRVEEVHDFRHALVRHVEEERGRRVYRLLYDLLAIGDGGRRGAVLLAIAASRERRGVGHEDVKLPPPSMMYGGDVRMRLHRRVELRRDEAGCFPEPIEVPPMAKSSIVSIEALSMSVGNVCETQLM